MKLIYIETSHYLLNAFIFQLYFHLTSFKQTAFWVIGYILVFILLLIIIVQCFKIINLLLFKNESITKKSKFKYEEKAMDKKKLAFEKIHLRYGNNFLSNTSWVLQYQASVLNNALAPLNLSQSI
ncbi:hypothetical protein BpHYR1_026197 [Brachionus plicatilis]|uniref:Uncharacterized protein n=1 Tax=Brachionus plicatilis TaxID=10195 RepID=A0A3M7SPY4_BRAPC|nr:hypothetical protein BpHYR1_026197 [Brachionus plicatilis]